MRPRSGMPAHATLITDVELLPCNRSSTVHRKRWQHKHHPGLESAAQSPADFPQYDCCQGVTMPNSLPESQKTPTGRKCAFLAKNLILRPGRKRTFLGKNPSFRPHTQKLGLKAAQETWQVTMAPGQHSPIAKGSRKSSM